MYIMVSFVCILVFNFQLRARVKRVAVTAPVWGRGFRLTMTVTTQVSVVAWRTCTDAVMLIFARWLY